MDRINIGERLIFDNLDLTPPKAIIESLIAQIKEQTKGIVIGVIKEYDGPIEPYKKVVQDSIPSIASMSISSIWNSHIQPKEEIIEVDIQNTLGKTGDELSKYEFYLGTPIYEQYKYRICFLQHGIANYPVKVVLEQGIADEINKRGRNSTCIYNINSPTELEQLMVEIVTSRKVLEIMQELININHINSEKNDDF